MIILWILLGLIALTALLLVVPVSLRVIWNGGEPEVRVRYLFISYTVYPRDREEAEKGAVRAYISELLGELKKKRSERKKKAAAQQPQRPKKSSWETLREQRGFFGALGYMLRIVRQSAVLGAYIVRRSAIVRMKLHAVIGGSDAAEIGITHGQWCAVVYPAVSLLLCSVRRYRNCSVNIVPDFLAAENKYDIDIRMNVFPFHGIVGAVKMLIYLTKAEVGERTTELTAEALKQASGTGNTK